MRMNHGVRLTSRITVPILLAVSLSLLLVSGSALAKGRPGGGGGSCVRATPGVAVDNNWSWSNAGSWGYPGQQLSYAINVINYDVGCAASTFIVDVQAPNGFAANVPTTTISLKAAKTGYLWAYVTSPLGATDGDYPLTVTVRRSNTSGPVGSFTSYYKVYTSDGTDPTIFWANPGDGQVLNTRTVNLTASSSDDHAVSKIDLFVDNTLVATTTCDSVTYICQISTSWSATTGSHTAAFWSYDWMGNSASLSISFTVGGTTAKTSTTTSSKTLAAPTIAGGSHRPSNGGHGKAPDVSGGSKGQGSGHAPKK
jgi:hypothetical protein